MAVLRETYGHGSRESAPWLLLAASLVVLACIATLPRVALSVEDVSTQSSAAGQQAEVPESADVDDGEDMADEEEDDDLLSNLYPGWGEDDLESPDPAATPSAVVSPLLSVRLDAYVGAAFEKSHVPGMALAVVGRDGILWESLQGDVTSESSPFVIGSLSKSFTAVGIMQLVEQGRVDLDADVTSYLTDLDLGAPVSVRQLLNQTSGLGSYQSVAQARVVGEQGTFSYANVNYDLLGKVIAAVSAQSYSSYMSENVFGPLGLTDTYASLSDACSAGLVPGHRDWFGLALADGFVHPCTDRAWGQEPSGYISSSLSDMCRYLRMYLNGGEGVISYDAMRQMFSANVYDAGSDTYYGMGWTTYDRGGELVQSHDGQVENYTSSMCIIPSRGVAVVMLSDLNDTVYGNYAAFTMMDDVITLVMGDDPLVEADSTSTGTTETGDGEPDLSDADATAQGAAPDIQELLFGTTLADADAGEYTEAHVGVNLTCVAFLIACTFQLSFSKAWARSMAQTASHVRRAARLVLLGLVHVALPVCLVALVPGYLDSDWAELWGFMPDATLVIALGTSALVAGGIARIICLQGEGGGSGPQGQVTAS